MSKFLSNRRHRATLATVALAITAGALFRWAGAPLPWLIGPLLACAAVNMASGRLYSPRAVLNAGQWIIGLVLGLYFSADVLAALGREAGLIAIVILWAIVLGFALAWLMRKLTGMDRATAFFASAIGGASEMMVQAERAGGVPASVAAAHSVRLMMVVVLIPFVYRWLDLHGSDPYQPAVLGVHAGGLLGLLALTAVGGFVADRLDAPNAWVIGALLVSATLTASGVYWSAVPGWLTTAGQIAIGMTLGTRFTPAFYRSAPRVALASVVVTAVSLLACGAFGWLLGIASGVAPATLILATAPGGIAEMSLTARNLDLGVPMVTAFQAARMVVLVLTLGIIYRWTLGRRDLQPSTGDPR